jgi:hypothetical protein
VGTDAISFGPAPRLYLIGATRVVALADAPSLAVRYNDRVLVVVFGAGASYDSNPDIPASVRHEHRPPLANALFEMDRQATREAADAFPMAAPALMAARADVRAGGTVEATLTRLQAEAEEDPRARCQLMALRFYLQRVLSRIPDAWNADAVRQTSYVSMLDQLARWQRDTGHGLCLITFNYDTLLEDACGVVFGQRFGHMDDYPARDGVHVYKPHGSVDWAQAAVWHGGQFAKGDAARRAICERPDVQILDGDLAVRAPTDRVIEQLGQDKGGPVIAWIPALAIPVEAKPDVVMPQSHRSNLQQDLAQATAVLCVGWRARETHFLRILQEGLPSRPLPLWSVSVDRESASETVDNLWRTGRFDRFLPVGGGFAQFADPEPPPGPQRPAMEPMLTDILRGTAATGSRPQGAGIPEQEQPSPGITYGRPPYAPFQ